ncbi:UNVERIFIED_CONTAM: hypothetical protein GTU68_031125, partial [Idotea baltica]|nr:hypothetical protein [Idotea baltica]
MEFNRKSDGSLVPLPHKHIDTGMGFERLACALQGKSSNYDTDIFQPLIQAIEKRSGVKYGRSDSKQDIALRVIADHVRAVSFSIADGQLPSNTGAGYVIRRILRRAIRYAYSFLDMREPFIYQLAAVLDREMGTHFTELRAQSELIGKVIKEEEESFLRTLSKGIARLEAISKESEGVVAGDKAFELFDTYGFPIDLTALILSEQGRTLDEAGFNAELEKQKARSRKDAASVTAQVDENKRRDTERNHSVTHLLHKALREVLGEHVQQKGSLVNADYLRFDFSHFSKVELEDVRTIENRVNQLIMADDTLKEHRGIPVQEALDAGAIALFGEKYGDVVRMIEFGESKELCGGTHVPSTGTIGLFRIKNESSVASGVRRIEA